VIVQWDPTAKKHDGEDVEIPVNFPPDIVRVYKSLYEKYVASAPVKLEAAKHLMEIIPLDVRFLLGCGLKWEDNDIEAEDPTALGGPAPAASPNVADADRSPSLVLPRRLLIHSNSRLGTCSKLKTFHSNQWFSRATLISKAIEHIMQRPSCSSFIRSYLSNYRN
jgi:hypothetical protein